MTKLSKTQQDVIDRLRQSGGRLFRMSGGFWTTDGVEVQARLGYQAPEWSVAVQTVRALERAGWLRRGEGLAWCADRFLVDLSTTEKKT